jgi:hypothetical protein
VAFSLLYPGLCRVRHQVRVLERQVHGRVQYRPVDRALLAALSQVLPREGWQAFQVMPATLVRWRREAGRPVGPAEAWPLGLASKNRQMVAQDTYT